MVKRKCIMLDLKRGNDVVFTTPVGSPEIVVGFLSSLVVPQNNDLELRVYLGEVAVDDEKKDN